MEYEQHGLASYTYVCNGDTNADGPIQWPWEVNAAMLSLIVVICTLHLLTYSFKVQGRHLRP